ncbi:cation:proton antiporter [Thalassomonas actiniarum]|uniref:Cation:proton antiporter n=1 Tax=Thalassomonas actiniarum TaxID=485447 RepID=A0AAE9YPK5_9GAMM|nr:cation:proton antiporter [Thalassomonas actiniarum]WDD98446.1 cation:proton antiporter [Thalassomonas actiniarum]
MQELINNTISTAGILVTLGLLFLIGLAAHETGKRTNIPRVTLLLLLGAIASPNALDIVPHQLQNWFPVVSQIALCMVGFLLGEQFIYRTLSKSGKIVWLITAFESVAASIFVFLLLYLLSAPIILALLLAGIAPASAPAATMDVVKESHLKGLLPGTLLKVVAIDDAFGIFLFALCLAAAEFISGSPGLYLGFFKAIWEILGAILIGCAIGWPMAKLTGRLSSGEPTLIEALGFVLLNGGLAQLSGASYLLSSIVLGAVVANFARHHTRPFHAIEGISTPLLIIFFFMAGFQFDISAFSLIGYIGGAYIISRSAGKILGGYFGAQIAGADKIIQNHIGWCLLPQAGVALGLALMAAERHPEYASQLLSLLVGTTIIFELFGPVLTRMALIKAAKANKAE